MLQLCVLERNRTCDCDPNKAAGCICRGCRGDDAGTKSVFSCWCRCGCISFHCHPAAVRIFHGDGRRRGSDLGTDVDWADAHGESNSKYDFHGNIDVDNDEEDDTDIHDREDYKR